MNATKEIEFKCPFFVDCTYQTLTCESFIGGTVMYTKFKGRIEMRHHIERFCVKEDGGKCPLAMNLYDKYEKLEALKIKRAEERHYYGLKED